MIHLLQTLILLLVAVQAPNVPIALREQAIQIAQQAVQLSEPKEIRLGGAKFGVKINYLDTYECFQSEAHFREVKARNLELYQRTEPAGSCSFGGYKIHINVPIIKNYEKDYLRGSYTTITAPTLSVSN